MDHGWPLTIIALVVLLVAIGPAAMAQPASDVADWEACAAEATSRQDAFARAADTSGVPEPILLGVSFMLTRWDDHATSPSTSGGFGPMHLTVPPPLDPPFVDHDPMGRGDASREVVAPDHSNDEPADEPRLDTLARAAELTGLSAERLRSDSTANICGGAALLADLQQSAGGATDLSDWSAAVALYAGPDEGAALRFATLVFELIDDGASRTTNDGEPVELVAVRGTEVDADIIAGLGLNTGDAAGTACPEDLYCDSIPAPYVWYGAPDPETYGNHDLDDRPADLEVTHLIIHDTEETWASAIKHILDPEWVSWNYTVRSTDGLVSQHMDAKDIPWHDGNWYSNTHSLGVEHEGYAAQGATWYTEILYRNSAELIGYLAEVFDVPLDRAHIRGHDNVPAPWPAAIQSMHWDPGPYWDWEHYFELLGAPIGGSDHPGDRHGKRDGHGKRHGHGKVRAASERTVTVVPDFDRNEQLVTGCSGDAPELPCPVQGSNFVYLHQEPSFDSPLVIDAGLHPGGLPTTRYVSDIGARAPAGHQFHVEERRGDWLGVWYLGEIGWLHSPPDDPKVVPVPPQERPRVVTTRGNQEIQVYGQALPEQSAYPDAIPYQEPSPLGYTIKPGQEYVLADGDIPTTYYYAHTYDCRFADLDCTVVVGQDRYHLIWFGYRMAYVRADDVKIRSGMSR